MYNKSIYICLPSCTSFSCLAPSSRSRPNSTTKGFPSPRYPWSNCKAFWAVSASAKRKCVKTVSHGLQFDLFHTEALSHPAEL